MQILPGIFFEKKPNASGMLVAPDLFAVRPSGKAFVQALDTVLRRQSGLTDTPGKAIFSAMLPGDAILVSSLNRTDNISGKTTLPSVAVAADTDNDNFISS